MTHATLQSITRSLTARGWMIQAQTATTITAIQPKQFSALGCIALGFLPYLLWHGFVERDKVWYIELLANGSTLWNGRTPEQVREETRKRRRRYATVGLMFLGVIVSLCVLWSLAAMVVE